MLQPGRFDVVAATNLFGDILSDLGPATTGTIGLAPSANLNPERTFPSLFEPVHGRRPTSTAATSPTPSPWSGQGALMLDFLTHGTGAGRQAHDAIVAAIEAVLRTGPRTPTWVAAPAPATWARPSPRTSARAEGGANAPFQELLALATKGLEAFALNLAQSHVEGQVTRLCPDGSPHSAAISSAKAASRASWPCWRAFFTADQVPT